MPTLLPNRSVDDYQTSPEYVSLNESDPIFDALSSDTARKIFAILHEEPTTISEIASRIESSVQNVSYHVENMETAGLITPVDTWYSTRGKEMDVFAATSQPLVLVSNDATKANVEGVTSD